MRIAISVAEKKGAKRKLRERMKKYGVTMQHVASESTFHYNTVRDALNPETKYWNPAVVDLAEKLIGDKHKLPA